MEEIEVPTEHLHEAIHEKVHEAQGHGHEAGVTWVLQVALCSALLAVLAAIAALFAGHHANEAMLEQIQASNRWAFFQAKGIKANVLRSKLDMLAALGKELPEKDNEKIAEYGKEQREIEESAREAEASSKVHLLHHTILARSVTFFQVAIALSAIAALTRKKFLFYGGLGIGVVGAVSFVQGLL